MIGGVSLIALSLSLAMLSQTHRHSRCAGSGCDRTQDCEWCARTGWRSRCSLCEERCGSDTCYSAAERVAIVLYGQLPRPRHVYDLDEVAPAIALVRNAVVPSLMKRLVAPAQARGADVHIFGHSWANGRHPAETRHSLLSALREGMSNTSVEVEVSSHVAQHLPEEIIDAIQAGTFYSNGHPGAFVSIERGLGLLQSTGLDFQWVVLTRWDVVFYTDYRLDLLSPALFYLPNICSVAAEAGSESCHALGPMLEREVEEEYAPDWVFAGSPSLVKAVFVDILSDFFNGYFDLTFIGYKNHGLLAVRLGSLQHQGVIAVGRYKYEGIDFDFIRELDYRGGSSFDPRLSPYHTPERTRCINAMDSADDIWRLMRNISSAEDVPLATLPAGALACDLKAARRSGDSLGPSCCPAVLTYCPCATSTAHLSVLTVFVAGTRPTVRSLCLESLYKPGNYAISRLSSNSSVLDEIHISVRLPCCVPAVLPDAAVDVTAETIVLRRSESAASESAARRGHAALSEAAAGTMVRRTWTAADLTKQAAEACFGPQLHAGTATEATASTWFALRWSLEQQGTSWAAAPNGLRITALLAATDVNASVTASDIWPP